VRETLEPRRILIHDGSFPGFLCAAAEALNARLLSPSEPVLRVRGPVSVAELFEERERVSRDDGRARALWRRLSAKAGEDAMAKTLEAFCSDLPGADEAAAAMIVRLWFEGAGALDDLASEEARLLEKGAYRAAHEAHRFMGLVRFAELSDGSWYARIAPDCDVLALIADHFAARYPAMRWAIHDGRRGTAILHEPDRGWTAVTGFRVAAGGELPFSNAEKAMREAWRTYFEAVAIKERTNPALQSSFLPKKHWGNLPEMESPRPA